MRSERGAKGSGSQRSQYSSGPSIRSRKRGDHVDDPAFAGRLLRRQHDFEDVTRMPPACDRLHAVSGWVARRSGSLQDRPDGIEDEVEPKLELVGVVEAGREQLTADTREVRVRIRRHLGDHR